MAVGACAPYNALMSAPNRVREDLRASIAAQRELGSDFEPEVVEGFLDRLSREMDMRLDQRLGARVAPPQRPRYERPRRGADFWSVCLALGSITMGVGVIGITDGMAAGAQIVVALVVWTAIAVINVAYALGRRGESR
jgi:hypothetical protein